MIESFRRRFEARRADVSTIAERLGAKLVFLKRTDSGLLLVEPTKDGKIRLAVHPEAFEAFLAPLDGGALIVVFRVRQPVAILVRQPSRLRMDLIKSASISVADSSIRSGFAQPHTRTSSLAAAILSGILSFTGLPSTNSADCTSGESASTLAAEVMMARPILLG